MNYDIFKITKQQLGENSNVKVKILGQAGELYYEMAMEMINEIKEKNIRNEKTVFICPVGPVGQYKIFVRLVNENKISLKNVYFFNMDEYLDNDKKMIDSNNPLSFRGFMKREVYEKINPKLVMPEDQRIFPEPSKEQEIWNKIQELGGVDVCFGGIGINGHVAFNEPPEENEKITNEKFKNLPTRILKISRETRAINAASALGGAIQVMPKWCITVGMKEILSARKIRLYCFRDWHRAVVREVIHGKVTKNVPASFIQQHSDAQIVLADNVAKLPY